MTREQLEALFAEGMQLMHDGYDANAQTRFLAVLARIALDQQSPTSLAWSLGSVVKK